MSATFDWLFDVFFPSIVSKLDSLYLVAGVSILGFFAALWCVYFIYSRLT